MGHEWAFKFTTRALHIGKENKLDCYEHKGLLYFQLLWGDIVFLLCSAL